MIITDALGQPYCVYAHYVDGQLVYIGSGDTCRAFTISTARSKHHMDLLHTGIVEIRILSRHSSRRDALDTERRMLRAFRPVANVKLGGREPRIRTRDGQPNKRKPYVLKNPKPKRIGKKSEAVLDVIRSAAEENDPCPTNAEIAARVGSMSHRVEDIVSSLAKRELIRVEMYDHGRRIVHVGSHATQPTAPTNIKGIATMRHGRRVIDRIIV